MSPVEDEEALGNIQRQEGQDHLESVLDVSQIEQSSPLLKIEQESNNHLLSKIGKFVIQDEGGQEGWDANVMDFDDNDQGNVTKTVKKGITQYLSKEIEMKRAET